MAEIILKVAIGLMLAGNVLGIFRLIKGPAVIDRVVAMDILTTISISLIVVITLISNRFIYIDVAIVYALLSFLGVIAIARCLESRQEI
jgi:multicomponent Na+:H+ antiporter subunit F